MELDPQILKEKALLLLHRERELFELRMKHERITIWFRLAQALPDLLGELRGSVESACERLRKALLERLKLQRVLFFEIEGASLRPLAPGGPARPFSSLGHDVVQADTVGVIDDASDPAVAAFAEAVGLTRFLWSRICVAGRPPILLAAGYDRAKAKFYPAFDASETANLRNATQHIQGLMANAVLVSQVHQERDRLQQANELLQARDVELRAMAEELRATNETLEQRVVERTTQLARRNRDMRLVLDNVPAALITIDGAGRLAEERSAKVDQWFGVYEGNPAFADFIAQSDPAFADQFALGHEALVQGTLPLDLCIDQLPTRIASKDRIYHCSYRPISGAADETTLLVMIEDVTEHLRLAQEEAEQSELLAAFQALTRDRAGFLTFFEEADRLVREITGGEIAPAVLKRHLHTLKGNASMMGARVIADLCHRAEDELVLDGSGIDEIVGRLQERWSAIRETVEPVVGGHASSIVEVPSGGLEQLRQDIERGLSRAEIQDRLAVLAFEPVERPLGRIARQASALADRMRKPDLSVVVESDGARVDPRRFGELWAALVHVVRNSVDHGIESPAERVAQGKDAAGRVILRTAHTPFELTVEVEDDGRGIDWARVAEIAAARGMPNESEADLLRAVLAEGFTTRSSVTLTSGRGVGMSALHQVVVSLGGTLSVRSEARRGTCWRLVLPLVPTTTAPEVRSAEAGHPGSQGA